MNDAKWFRMNTAKRETDKIKHKIAKFTIWTVHFIDITIVWQSIGFTYGSNRKYENKEERRREKKA